MTLTHQLIEAGRTPRGGYNMAQLKAIGVKLSGPLGGSPSKGWLRRLVGAEVTHEAYDKFLMFAKIPLDSPEKPT